MGFLLALMLLVVSVGVASAESPSGTLSGWVLRSDGTVEALGQAHMGNFEGQGRAVAIAAPADQPGYYLVSDTGDVDSHGTVADIASPLTGMSLAQPVVDATIPTDGGLLLAARDGGVFALGGARFRGSLGSIELDQPVTGIAAAPGGYWLVAADGGVFAFGDAPFLGSLPAVAPGVTLAAPIVDIVATPSGKGYWLLGADGGVFAFGDAPFLGSIPAGNTPSQIDWRSMVASGTNAYVLVGSDLELAGFNVLVGTFGLTGEVVDVAYELSLP